MYLTLPIWIAGAVAAAQPQAAPRPQGRPTVVAVLEAVPVAFDAEQEEPVQRQGVRITGHGQLLQRTLRLPEAPDDQRDAQRIVATVTLRPALVEAGRRQRPGDPWTRVGSVTVHDPDAGPDDPGAELMRFTTGFGGPGTFSQDVTALAPLLHGARTLRLFVSTYSSPAWEATLTLTYDRSAGYRRPALAEPLFNEPAVTSSDPLVAATVVIPPGLARPRLRILTTGHATDGAGGDEFVSRTHVLRIDGRRIASWRPWREGGGALRERNPTSGRTLIDGRWLWSSDLDRAGWAPGTAVEPMLLPVPELTAGRHEVELEILGIRPAAGDPPHHGYWRVSAIVVADEPWPAP